MDTDIVKFSVILDALFGDSDPEIAALYRLSDMSPDDEAAFCTRFSAATEERRESIARHMADLTEENFAVEFSPTFAIFLEDDCEGVRLAALDGLWDSENVRVIRPIINIMQTDKSLQVRRAAAKALAHYVLLGEWGQISATYRDLVVETLFDQYTNRDTPAPVRTAALEGLGAAGDDRVPALIEDAYESGEYDFQISALFAMGNSADKRWINMVIDEMESPYADMRAEAARAAGEIGRSEAISLLAQLTYDEDSDVQINAIMALGKIGGDMPTRILNDLLEDPDLEELTDTIEEAIEAMDWMGQGFNVDGLDWD